MTEDAPIMSIAHEWEPITDLPDDWHDLCRPDLHAVHRQWVAERKLVKDEEKLQQFQEELALHWAIETGIIERLYRVDRGITIQIMEAGLQALEDFHDKGDISADAKAHITDQREALDMVMDLVGDENRELTAFYIKSLHQRLTLSQETCEAKDQFGNLIQVPLRKGEWNLRPNNPLEPDGSLHEYCPPEQVPGEIERLLAWHKQHEALDVCPEVEAAWLHHRFAQIHPFQDGNGRVSRALTGAVFLKANYLVLVIRDEEDREPYLDALQAADKGKLKPLVDLFADVQLADLQEALKIIRSLRGEETVQAIGAAATAARQSQEATAARVAGALGELIRVASVRFEEIAAETRHAFETQGVVVSTTISDGDATDFVWSGQILEDVKRRSSIDTERPWRWVSLRLGLPARPEMDAQLVIVLYSTGRQPRQYAASAFLMRPPRGDRDWEPRATFADVHHFDIQSSASETQETVIAEFREWLEGKITSSLQTWGYDL